MPQHKPAQQHQAKSAHAQRLPHHPTPTTQVALSHATVQRALANPRALAPNDILQLQRTIGNQAVLRMLNGPAKPVIQRDTQRGFEAGADFEHQLSRSKGGGAPLPKETREGFEASFGTNFGNVRVHTGATANQLSRSIQAKAFTHGNDIHFGAGEYNPASSQGQHLLAHELTHTIQQGGVQQGGGQQGTGKQAKGVQTKLQVGPANDRYEREADRVATQVSQLHHQPQPQRSPQPQTMTSSGLSQGSAHLRVQRSWRKEKITFNGQTESVKKNSKTKRNKAITNMAMTGKTAVDKGKQLEAVIVMGTSGEPLSKVIDEVVPESKGFVHVERASVQAAISSGKKGKKAASTSIQNEAKSITGSIVDTAKTDRRNLLYKDSGESVDEYKAMMAMLNSAGYHITVVMSYTKPNEEKTFLDLTDPNKDNNLIGEAFLFDSTVAERPKLIWQKGEGREVKSMHHQYIKNSLVAIDKNQGKPSTPAPSMVSRSGSNYLQAGGAELWETAIASNTSPKLTKITNSLRKFNQFKAGNRGNAEEQAKLLLSLQKQLNNFSAQKQNTVKSAALTLKEEVEDELRNNPIRLQNVSDAEMIEELVKVGFTQEFFAKNIKSNLHLLYEAHAALSHNQRDLAQNAFDQLNPVMRDDSGKLQSNSPYLKRGHNALYYAQNALTAYHHETIGGEYARSIKPTPMNAQKRKNIKNHYRIDDKSTDASADKKMMSMYYGQSWMTTSALASFTSKYPGLKGEEIQAIRMYTTDFYSYMNATLQDVRLTNPDEHENHEAISSTSQLAQNGLSKLPSYKGGSLYRIDTNQGGLVNFAQPGTTFRTPLFMSTSKSPDGMPFRNPVAWYIKVAAQSRAKDIQEFSVKKGEQEVLIPPGTKMKIADVYQRDSNQAPAPDKPESDEMTAGRLYHSEKGNKQPSGDMLKLMKFCWSHPPRGSTVIIAEELSD